MKQVDERQRAVGHARQHLERVAVVQPDVAERRMMNDGPVGLIAAKLGPGGEFRFGTDHPVYLRHALAVMRRHAAAFEWLVEGPESWQNRPGGWTETRYEAKARRLGHEIWYFRYRRR